MKNKAIFLDKDGTLIPDIPYNVNADLITLQPDSIDGLLALYEAGYMFIVVSNQSGVARGVFAEDKLQWVKAKIEALLALHGIVLSGFYYCPHHTQGSVKKYVLNCECRKPRPGMLLQAAAEHQIDLQNSWMIGDILNDVEAGSRAGCNTILLDNGNETEWLPGEYREPTMTCKTLNEAAMHILKSEKHELERL